MCSYYAHQKHAAEIKLQCSRDFPANLPFSATACSTASKETEIKKGV